MVCNYKKHVKSLIKWYILKEILLEYTNTTIVKIQEVVVLVSSYTVNGWRGTSIKTRKFNSKKDYKGRVLLIVVHEGILKLDELSNWILNYKQDNFRFVYLAFLEAKEKKTWIYTYDIKNKKYSADCIKFTSRLKNIIERLYKK